MKFKSKKKKKEKKEFSFSKSLKLPVTQKSGPKFSQSSLKEWKI